MAFKCRNVIGFITQENVSNKLLNFSPGVNLSVTGDNQGQRYRTPQVMAGNSTHIFIVGRGIYSSSDPVESCLRYKADCYSCLNHQIDVLEIN